MPHRVYVDRIEGERAILLAGPEGRLRLDIPSLLLPDGTKEGAALDLSLEPAPGDPTKSEVARLMEDLFARGEEKEA